MFRLIIIFLASSLLFCGCKKVKDKVDSEKSFHVFFADSAGYLKNYCYDRVYGLGNTNLSSCGLGTNGIELPLSITKDSCTFLFVKGKITDTITIAYTKSTRLNGTEYEVFYKVKMPPKNTFDNFSMTCVPQLESYCKAYEGMMGIVFIKDEKEGRVRE